jgi:tRNA U34 5-carboxymethylaminomethyl modifying enzyme MnmG/GidA
MASISELLEKLPKTHYEGIPLDQWLRRSENRAEDLPSEIKESYSLEIWSLIETDLKFEGYLKREELQIQRAKKQVN